MRGGNGSRQAGLGSPSWWKRGKQAGLGNQAGRGGKDQNLPSPSPPVCRQCAAGLQAIANVAAGIKAGYYGEPPAGSLCWVAGQRCGACSCGNTPISPASPPPSLSFKARPLSTATAACAAPAAGQPDMRWHQGERQCAEAGGG